MGYITLATGWGLTYGANVVLPNVLHWVQLPIHSHEYCLNADGLGSYITDGMVCAGSSAHSTCNVSRYRVDLAGLLMGDDIASILI